MSDNLYQQARSSCLLFDGKAKGLSLMDEVQASNALEFLQEAICHFEKKKH